MDFLNGGDKAHTIGSWPNPQQWPRIRKLALHILPLGYNKLPTPLLLPSLIEAYKMSAISRTEFSHAFSWMKYLNFVWNFTEVCS